MEAPCMHKTKLLCRHQKLMPHQRVSHSSTSPRATLGMPSGPHVFQSTASDKVITETLRTWAPGAVWPQKTPPRLWSRRRRLCLWSSPSLQGEEAALAPRHASTLLKDAPQWFPMRPSPSVWLPEGWALSLSRHADDLQHLQGFVLISGFPHRSVGKLSACNAGDPSSISRSGRSAGEGIGYPLQYSWSSLVAQLVKNPPAVRETWVQSLDWEDPLEKGKAARSSFLAWRIPWTRVRHN